ncbi:hypothetical protein ACOSQ2_014932 [Xanthoceras sorbifolium]
MGVVPVFCNLIPPPIGTLKMNIDVAIRANCLAIGVGVAIRNSEGLLVAALAKQLPRRFAPEVGEFLALREGLFFMKSGGLVVCCAEVDACNVASRVIKPISVFGGVTALVIQDIKALFREVGVSKCCAIPRLGNRVAHSLASLALSSSEELCWHNVCLSDVFPCL